LAHDPHNADAFYFIGTLYSFRREDEAARRSFEQARSLDPKDAETRFRLAKAYQRLDDWGVAEQEFLQAIALNPRHVAAMNALGWLYYNQNKISQAEQWWSRVLQISPNDLEARDSLAKSCNDKADIYLKSRQLSKAKKLWKQALKYDHKNKASQYFLNKYGN